MLFLSESNVRQCIAAGTSSSSSSNMMECLQINRQAYISLTEEGGAIVPTRLGLPYHDQGDWSLFKAAAFYPPSTATSTRTTVTEQEEGTIQMGLKVISIRTNNPSNGLPLVPATILVLDATSGIVDAVVAATYLSALRTASGSAWATKLCRPTAKHLVIFGAGLQAQCHIDTITTILAPHQLERITIVNRSRGRADALVEQYSQTHPTIAMDVILLEDRAAIQRVLTDSADIVACCTNTATPTLFDGAWLRPNTHVNGIGSYTPDMQEVDTTVVNRCSTLLIDTPEAMTVGDLKHLQVSDDADDDDDDDGPVVVLLGDVLQDSSSLVLPSGNSAEAGDVTFYKAVGTAIQDVMTGDWVVKRAKELDIGQSIDMD